MRREPFLFEGITGFVQFLENVFPVALDEVGEHKAIVNSCSPEDQRPLIGIFPEMRNQRPHQQLLSEAHARVWGHFESAELNEAQTRRSGVGRIKLVDT